jgi:PAT family beta-lactamase induction signal transducer AmpG
MDVVLPADTAAPDTAAPRPLGRMALYALLGFSAGLPFYMFSTVLALRLADQGVGLVVIGFFAWVTLLPTFKWAWAPLLDRYSVPGFARFWGRRRGWIMLAQLGIAASLVAMALFATGDNLPLTALFAVQLAFWTTTLEVAADAWRIELAPTAQEQGPIVAANLWGYRSAMVAAGSGALILADASGWTIAYLAIAVAAFAPFPLLASLPAAQDGEGRRGTALMTGLLASAAILVAVLAITALVGSALLALAGQAGIGADTNVTPVVLAICLLPFLLLALALPRIRRASPAGRLRASGVTGPYVDVFWRFGYGALAILLFVSLYRMGDVLALTLAKPLVRSLGYSLTAIGLADGVVALAASLAGVALGGWLVMRIALPWALAAGAVAAAAGNWALVWLAYQPPGTAVLYLATGADQFGNGMAGAVFVVYLSMLVNPRHAGAQYALLSGFAFLLPRLLAGASGAMQVRIGFDGFFILAGALSLLAVLLLPIVARLRPRQADA